MKTSQRAFEADGKIIDVDQGIAVIDIGADDGVKKGMVFKVYYVEGNQWINKSMAVVRKADPGVPVAVVELFKSKGQEQSDAVTTVGEPVIAGDLISNPFFKRGREPKFFLDGDFKKHNEWGVIADKDDVMRKIREYGGAVVSEITVETDFVVLGKGYKQRHLDRAKELGTKVISKADILEFLDSKE